MSNKPITFFVRPYNLALSSILQNLSIISHFARKTNGNLTAFSCPREPETQKLLNFGSITVQENAARALSKQQQFRIPINERAALDSATLLYELPLKERGASLEEVADLVGIRLGKAFKRTEKVAEVMSDEGGFSNESRRTDHFIDLKVERRRNAPSRRPSNHSNLNPIKEKQLIREMVNFGGFTTGL